MSKFAEYLDESGKDKWNTKYFEEERIYKLCEYVIDLINEISYYENNYNLNVNLGWVKDEIKSIREDIDNS